MRCPMGEYTDQAGQGGRQTDAFNKEACEHDECEREIGADKSCVTGQARLLGPAAGGSERECDQNGDACAVEHELVGEVEASLKELSIKDVVAYVPVERGERRAAKEKEEAPGKHCV